MCVVEIPVGRGSNPRAPTNFSKFFFGESIMGEFSSITLRIIGLALSLVMLTALLGQLVFLYFGGIIEFFENMGFYFTYRTKLTEALLAIVFFYYVYNLGISREGALIIIILYSFLAFALGRVSRSTGQSLLFGIIAPYLALVILLLIVNNPLTFLEFAFMYGYTAFQSLIGAIFAIIGAYSKGEM